MTDVCLLSVLSEIGNAETHRRLILAFLADARHNKDNDRDQIGHHFDQFLGTGGQTGDIYAQNVQTAEQK